MPINQNRVEGALRQFVSTMENLGGVEVDENGEYHPRADWEWIDLGHAYVEACNALECEAVIEECDIDDYDDWELIDDDGVITGQLEEEDLPI